MPKAARPGGPGLAGIASAMRFQIIGPASAAVAAPIGFAGLIRALLK